MSNIFSTTQSKRNTVAELEIDLAGTRFPLHLRTSSRARSILVSADTLKGIVRLTVPTHADKDQALRFALSKSDWLAQRFAEAVPPIAIVDGTQISVSGEPYRISWSQDFARKPMLFEDEIRVGGPEQRVEGRIIQWLQDRARFEFENDLIFYCEKACLEYPKLSIGDAKGRWGSCSGRKAIRLNWRLIMAPNMVRRSVVAHEVAHLKHLNHSKNFYEFLDSLFEGDRRKADNWLKDHGRALHMIGASQQLVES